MKHSLFALVTLFAFAHVGHSQKIEYCSCKFKIDPSYLATAPKALQADSLFPAKIDSSFKTTCGYLIVPENRSKLNSKKIKLPFIIVHTKNPAKRQDPVLFTSGGPGNSSLGWAQGISKSTLVNDRDCIAFEQRGTRYAIPYLRLFDLDEAVREAYRKNLDIDSNSIAALQRYKKKLQAKGIDLDGYNSDETVSDIADLISLLKIDSINLLGGSYSGGLMMAVAQKIPQRIRSLVLDSPLPMFTAINEDEPVNFHEALHTLAGHVNTDSSAERYKDIDQKFRAYFTSIAHQKFSINYLERGAKDSIRINYTKNELLSVVVASMLDMQKVREVPFIITEMISGHHEAFVRQKLDAVFNRYPSPDGMRISVYCADQAGYTNQAIISQLYALYPYMNGFPINDVDKDMCDCWKSKPVRAATKQAFYSSIPLLTCDGELDAACRPLYMRQIKHYFPNTQAFLFINRGHGVGGKDFFSMTQSFIDEPMKTLLLTSKDVISY